MAITLCGGKSHLEGLLLVKPETRNTEPVREKRQAYHLMKNIRGPLPYYQCAFYDLIAMIRQLGTPTWFFILSAADLKWPDMIQTIARQYGVSYTDDEVAAFSFEDKSNWLKHNPVTAARLFQYRLNPLFSGAFAILSQATWKDSGFWNKN